MKNGKTPLHIASEKGWLHLVIFLTEVLNADPFIKDYVRLKRYQNTINNFFFLSFFFYLCFLFVCLFVSSLEGCPWI